jgi:N4-gp56 family major capsid protein
MATTTFGVNDANAVKLWARRLGFQIIYRTDISALVGEDPNSIIQLKPETQKSAGDKVTFSLMTELLGDGFTEGEVAEGNGESLSIFADAILINELGHVVGVPNKGRAIDDQRVPFNLRDAARLGLRGWWNKRLSVVFFNHVCGYTPETRLKYVGNNAILAPSSGRQIWVDTAGNNSDGDENLASDDVMSLKWIDYARELAETGSNPVRPINVEGYDDGRDISGGRYVMYLHPYQVTDIRTNASTGQWLDIQKAALANGQASKNPIYTDALGEYNNVILKKANHVTPGANSATPTTSVADVRRAVLLGAQACAMATSKAGGATDFDWNEELLDHKRKLEVSVMSIFGMKKTRFNGTDFGTVVVSSYAAPHNA